MKILIVLLTLSFSALADHHGGKGEMFKEVKAKAIENIGKRIGLLNDLKSCVSSANDRKAMKACRESHKPKMEALRAERKAFKSSMKAKRKAKREQRKAKNQ